MDFLREVVEIDDELQVDSLEFESTMIGPLQKILSKRFSLLLLIEEWNTPEGAVFGGHRLSEAVDTHPTFVQKDCIWFLKF